MKLGSIPRSGAKYKYVFGPVVIMGAQGLCKPLVGVRSSPGPPNNSLLAQLVEHLHDTQEVTGSIPRRNYQVRLIRCDHSVMVAPHVVTLLVRVQIPLVTPNKFNAALADVVIATD